MKWRAPNARGGDGKIVTKVSRVQACRCDLRKSLAGVTRVVPGLVLWAIARRGAAGEFTSSVFAIVLTT